MFFSKKPTEEGTTTPKPVRTYHCVRVHLSGRAERIWSWDFHEVNSEEEAKKYFNEIQEKLNASKDGDYVSLGSNVTVRRNCITEVNIYSYS